MAKNKKTGKPVKKPLPKPKIEPEVKPIDPEDPIISEVDPEIIPDDEEIEAPPYEPPPPAEGP